MAFFGRLAEIASEYLRKGSQVYVEGELRTRKWQDRDGNDRYSTEIVANEMQMLGGRSEGGGGTAQPREPDSAPEASWSGDESASPSPPAAPKSGPSDDFDDDIPF